MVFAGLVFCNVCWSLSYALSKHLMLRGYHPLEITFLRHFFGLFPLLFLALRGGRRSALVRRVARWRDPRSGASEWRIDLRIVAVGLLTFFLSPVLQMKGLSLSRAIDSSLMIAIEPLVTILLAVAVLREKLGAVRGVSILLAIAGALVLSDASWEKLVGFSDARLVGNAIFLSSLVFEALYSILSKPVLDRRPPELFSAAAVFTGVSALLIHNLVRDGAARASGLAPLIASGSAGDWAAVLFMGLLCTGFAYYFWMAVLSKVSLSSMAMTLYLQPVLGMVWGDLFLGERITASTLGGAALILTAVFVGTRRHINNLTKSV